ncbi:hypothetical protein [Pseudomonas nitroreducens]|uniref:hypothetical protein n=1 Tax=Pseudomonas nitroreducens TaxID=46680 RepID=UPI001FB781C0|nr:hypothetical protein [Pseudomonas nitroreducens]MCJ1881133.1 hypothetical protein [Pseudomonas nitroreducens]MCJ1895807.1 hypothetical protein [Pseudomonas nitroreducens]
MNHRHSNYFAINKASNLIVEVVCTRYTPTETSTLKFIPANDKALNAYYKWNDLNPDALMDIGDLMSRSSYVNDVVCNGRQGKAVPLRISYRAEQHERTIDRETSIIAWIEKNPDCDAHDLHEAFGTGTLAARAYLDKHSQ